MPEFLLFSHAKLVLLPYVSTKSLIPTQILILKIILVVYCNTPTLLKLYIYVASSLVVMFVHYS